MNGSLSAHFDWRGWHSGITRRLDRRTLAAALMFASFLVAFWFLTVIHRGPAARLLLSIAASQFTNVTVALLALAMAMVAIERGASAWVAYPLAACAIAITGLATGLVLDPNNFFGKMRSPGWAAITYLGLQSTLAVAGVVYVQQSNAAQSAAALQRLETERTAEAQRLAHRRLQAELATIDHDLVLSAMRLALASPTARAEALLAAVSAYLRAAQQRDATDPASVATTLGELKQLCRSASGGPRSG